MKMGELGHSCQLSNPSQLAALAKIAPRGTSRLTDELPKWQPHCMKLREYMSEQRVTYRALAARLGVHHAHLHRIAYGRRKATLAFALKLQAETAGAVMPQDLISHLENSDRSEIVEPLPAAA